MEWNKCAVWYLHFWNCVPEISQNSEGRQSRFCDENWDSNRIWPEWKKTIWICIVWWTMLWCQQIFYHPYFQHAMMSPKEMLSLPYFLLKTLQTAVFSCLLVSATSNKSFNSKCSNIDSLQSSFIASGSVVCLAHRRHRFIYNIKILHNGSAKTWYSAMLFGHWSWCTNSTQDNTGHFS